MAPSAKVVMGLKLDQVTMIATDYFTRIYGRESCGHSDCASTPERARRTAATSNQAVLLS